MHEQAFEQGGTQAHASICDVEFPRDVLALLRADELECFSGLIPLVSTILKLTGR
jgi:hypothetical protein